MKKRTAVFLVLLALACSGCGDREPSGPPPDLTGSWSQVTEDANYYHIAVITEDEMFVYWYTPSDGSRDLYWAGTFVPPATGEEPYKWTSENRRDTRRDASRFTLVDDTKEFTYKDGKITYQIMMSHITSTMALVRDPDAPVPSPERLDQLRIRPDSGQSAPTQSAPTQSAPTEEAVSPAQSAPITQTFPPTQPVTPPEAPPNQLP